MSQRQAVHHGLFDTDSYIDELSKIVRRQADPQFLSTTKGVKGAAESDIAGVPVEAIDPGLLVEFLTVQVTRYPAVEVAEDRVVLVARVVAGFNEPAFPGGVRFVVARGGLRSWGAEQ